MKTLLCVLALLFVSVPVSAQTATSDSKLAWDQAAPSLAVAQGYTYRLKADAAAPSVVSGVTCAGTVSPFVCSIPFPAFPPGSQHALVLTAADGTVESLPSAPFSFTFVVVPTAPANLRAIPGR